MTMNKIAFAYIAIDAIAKAYPYLGKGQKAVTFSVIDTTLWHFLASLMIPGAVSIIIINGSHFVLSLNGTFINKFSLYTPVILAMSALPFIIEPSDTVANYMMNKTVRKSYSHLFDDMKKM